MQLYNDECKPHGGCVQMVSISLPASTVYWLGLGATQAGACVRGQARVGMDIGLDHEQRLMFDAPI